MKLRLLVAMLAAGFLAPGGLLAQQPTEGFPIPAFVVRDADGRVLGPMIGLRWDYGSSGQPGGSLFQADVAVMLQIHGEKIVVTVEPYRLHAGITLYFDQPGCQGNAYLKAEPEGLQALRGAAFAIDPDQVLFRADMTDDCPLSTPYQSRSSNDAGGCTDTTSTVGRACKNATPVVDLLTLYTPPYRLE